MNSVDRVEQSIKRSKPVGEIVHRGGSSEIGTVIWCDGEVEIVPRRGLTTEQAVQLERAAEDALYCGPDPRWALDPEIGWIGCVSVCQPRSLRSASMCSALGAPQVTDRIRARSSRLSRASSSPLPAMLTASVSAT